MTSAKTSASSPIPRSATGWRRAAAIAKRVGAILVEEAPTILLLRRDSPRIMWALTAWTISRKIAHQVRREAPSHWKGGSNYNTNRTILMTAMSMEIGDPVSVADDGTPCRRVGKCIFGASDGALVLPREGSIDDFLDAFWGDRTFDLALDRENYTLTAGSISVSTPSDRTRSIADDCRKLRDAGHRVGLLIDGPPGTGKSEALRYVGAQLGGRVLRASLSKDSRTIIADYARHLLPDVVIIDDIDRMDSEFALDAVDQLLALGCAVLATSNAQSKVCDAILRSGRIDMHHVFEGCEADLFERLTVGLNPDQVELLKGATVATIVRHNELAATIGKEKAAAFVRHGR